VNRNVFQSAWRKIGLCHWLAKLCKPTQCPESEPAVASVKLSRSRAERPADEQQDEDHRRRDQRGSEEAALLEQVGGATTPAPPGENCRSHSSSPLPGFAWTRNGLRCVAAVAGIELDRLTKVYPDGTRAVSELSLDVADGEFVVFVGPSGCGKTSALRMIAGLEEITDGTVTLGGAVVNALPPKDRTSRWCSRTTRSTRTCRLTRTWRSASSCAASQGRDRKARRRDRARPRPR